MTELDKAIKRNRTKHARWARAERILRMVRQRVFDYEDAGPEMDAKAQKVIATCQRILAPKWKAEREAREASRMRRWEESQALA
jgi:hypothetical protein